MTLDDLELARAIHILALVHWIDGVATVTAIVLPRARQMANAKAAVAAFEEFERRFAPQARVSISLAGLSGVYMLAKLDAWYRFQYASFWWLHLMVAVWGLFAFMVYLLEPLAIHRLFHGFALRQTDRAFARNATSHDCSVYVGTCHWRRSTRRSRRATVTGAPWQVSVAHIPAPSPGLSWRPRP